MAPFLLIKAHKQAEKLNTLSLSLSLTSISFNRSKILTGSVRLLKFSPGPMVTARTGLPTTVVMDAFVPSTCSVAFVIGKSAPVLWTAKSIPTLVFIDWKREGGRKTAAVLSSLRALKLVFPVWPPDEKFLPAVASSACGSCSGGGKCGSDCRWQYTAER